MELPYIENYHSDYTQLCFFYDRSGTIALYSWEEDEFGQECYHLMWINLLYLKAFMTWGFDKVVESFMLSWAHEFLHMLGVTDEGVEILRDMGVNV